MNPNPMDRRFACRFLLAVALLFPGLATIDAQEATSLVVSAMDRSAEVGQRASVDVKLMSAEGRPVAAGKDLPVTLEIVSPSGKTMQAAIVFKPGEKAVRYQLPLTEAGVFEVRARNRELLGGADLVQARSATSVPRREMIAPRPAAAPAPTVATPPPPPLATPAATPTPSATPARAFAHRAAIARGARNFQTPPPLRALASAPRPPTAAEPESAAPVPPSASGPPPAAATPPAGALQKLVLDLRYSPQRRFLANGKDSARIFALVHGAPPDKDTKLFLFNSDGSLVPKPLIIRKGEPLGEAELNSDQVGKVKLDYWWSDGWVEFDAAPTLAIEFAPPITQIRFKASPHDISLFDEGQLVVQLTDENGTPIATDTNRRVTFSIDDGRGSFAAREVDISPGHSDQSTTFFPLASGDVKMTASSENLRDQTATISVTWPVLLLVLAGVGGLIGGALAFGTRRKDPALRILGGVIIGPLLLWALIVGLLPHATLSRPLLLNPVGAFFVALIGGWIGTEIFTPIVKALVGIAPKEKRP